MKFFRGRYLVGALLAVAFHHAKADGVKVHQVTVTYTSGSTSYSETSTEGDENHKLAIVALGDVGADGKTLKNPVQVHLEAKPRATQTFPRKEPFWDVQRGNTKVYKDQPKGGVDNGPQWDFTTSRKGSYRIAATYNNTVRIRIVPVALVTPAGDPVNKPVEGGDGSGTVPDGANEFTYSTASPGVLTIKLKASAPGLSAMPQAFKDKLKFDIDPVGNSVKAWDSANPGGKPTISGDDVTATVTFTGLPSNNSDFGTKKARILLGDAVSDEESFEVFFPRDEKNHPGTGAGITPNWFFYWKQITSGNLEYGTNPPTLGVAAETVGMTRWSYTAAPDKTLIILYDGVVCSGKSYQVGKLLSGIDQFLGTVIHEKKHVSQITKADKILPTNGSDTFRYGWSWNSFTTNHFNKGPDGKWGRAGVDDDNNGTVDDAAPTKPFEPGYGDDENLDDPNYTDWPKTWSLPVPMKVFGSPIESEAVNATDSTYDENKNARKDWGNPGKNHKTLDKWDD